MDGVGGGVCAHNGSCWVGTSRAACSLLLAVYCLLLAPCSLLLFLRVNFKSLCLEQGVPAPALTAEQVSNFILKMMNSLLKITNFVFRMMNFGSNLSPFTPLEPPRQQCVCQKDTDY